MNTLAADRPMTKDPAPERHEDLGGKTERIALRVDRAFNARLEAAARESGVGSVSAWVRMALTQKLDELDRMKKRKAEEDGGRE